MAERGWIQLWIQMQAFNSISRMGKLLFREKAATTPCSPRVSKEYFTRCCTPDSNLSLEGTNEAPRLFGRHASFDK